MERPPATVELARCDAVASGTVLSVRGVGEPFQEAGGTYYGGYDITLRVERAFKGARRGRRLRLRTGYLLGGCGYPFEVGHSYLVYARRWKEHLVTDICTRTVPLDRATEDLHELESLAGSR